MATEFIKVFRVEHNDEMVIPMEVHLQYPNLYPIVAEEAPVEVVEEVVKEVVVVPPTPTKIRKK